MKASIMDQLLPEKNQLEKKTLLIFLIGILLLTAAAFYGYKKLHYGFNFIDEGYHMTESWRLTQGDHLLDNQVAGPLMPYTVLNSIIFNINPDITLLKFRKIQYILTLFALLIFSIGLYVRTKSFWYLPLIFSVFAFTGLDPIGMMANLNYYTYPHLFLVLFAFFIIIGLYAREPKIRKPCFVASGFCIWAISLSLLYLSVVAIVPVLLYVACKTLPIRSFSYTLTDLLVTLIPFAACWSLFIALYAQSFIPAAYDAVISVLSVSGYSPPVPETLVYITVSAIFLLFFYFISQMAHRYIFLLISFGVSVFMYFVIETSLFGLLPPYYHGWFGRPMWFSALIIAFIVIFWGIIIWKAIQKKGFNASEELALVLMLPVTIKSLSTVVFSGLKALTVLHSAIPAIAALAILLFDSREVKNKPIFSKLIIMVCVLAPFYCTTAWADWQFTYFDVIPKQADTEIRNGFGKNLKTNPIYSEIYKWIDQTARKYSDKNDYMISYCVTPMVHMITRRKPALNDTFIDYSTREFDVYKDAIKQMKENNREPAIAFVFQRMPVLYPISLEKGTYQWPPEQFHFKNTQDPISRYIKKHMILAAKFYLSKEKNNAIQCYVQPNTKTTSARKK